MGEVAAKSARRSGDREEDGGEECDAPNPPC